METATYLANLHRNKANIEAKIDRFSKSGDPEQLAHLPRLRHHLKTLHLEIDKHTPKNVEPMASEKTHAPESVNPVEKKPRSKKNAGRK